MNHRQFEAAVRRAMNGLPDWVHAALENIEVIVLDEADQVLDPERQGLLGLYVGLPLPERGVDYAGELPDVIYLFRKPHLKLNLSPHDLRREIAKTLIHEIAHYFGIDDDHLEELGWGWSHAGGPCVCWAKSNPYHLISRNRTDLSLYCLL